MTTYCGKRMLLVHAHPDDETLTTGGVIAKYAALGVSVTVLTCTLGEMGEVIGDRLHGLIATEADQLGGYRIGELTGALEALHPTLRPMFLGGAGCWRDSGMNGEELHPRAFVAGDRTVQARQVVEVIDRERPDVVITYDPRGGYGHPDHIRAHEITMDAVERSDHNVSKVYWAVTRKSALHAHYKKLRNQEFPDGWRLAADGELPFVDDAAITCVVDVSDVIDRKRAALAHHATQVAVHPTLPAFVLSNNVIQPMYDAESFVEVHRDSPAIADHDPRVGRSDIEDDVFAGL